jgi:hypothetical protein
MVGWVVVVVVWEVLWFGGLVVVGALVSLVVVVVRCVCGRWEQRWKREMQHGFNRKWRPGENYSICAKLLACFRLR